ncbi:MAG: hypothetical protein AAGJ46_15875 [Planctomycetota bacterium]
MTRHEHLVRVAVVVLLAAGSVASAQENQRPRSLAGRLSNLRFGWLSRGEETAAPAAKAEATSDPAKAGTQTKARTGAVAREGNGTGLRSAPLPKTRAGGVGASDSNRRRLPQLDARDLLPPNSSFGRPDPRYSETTQKTGVTPQRPVVVRGVGSARARMLRDLRKEGMDPDAEAPVATSRRSEAEPSTAKAKPATPVAQTKPRSANQSAGSDRKPPARAGSVLSANTGSTRNAAKSNTAEVQRLRNQLAERPAEQAPSIPRSAQLAAADKRALSKSLAAEIAREMAEDPTPKRRVEVARPTPQVEVKAPIAKTPVAPEDEKAEPAPSEEAPVAPPVAPTITPLTPSAAVDATPDEQPVIRFDGVTAEGSLPKKPAPAVERKSTPSRQLDTTVAPLTASEAELLMSEKMPLIASRVDGPRRIVIGREAVYTVLLVNRGEAAAEEMVARVRVPAWADIAATDASQGAIGSESGAGERTVVWRLDRFPAKSSAELELKLIAREGRAIKLGVDWRHAPVGATAVVEVQEPKLELALNGPGEVTFGKPERYQLTFSNPGTGTAEDVTVLLVPPGKPVSEASRHTIGSLGAGKTKTVQIELTAREAGDLKIAAYAAATDLQQVSAEKRLFCRKPKLQVDWRGPAEKYAGAPGTYYFRVRNPGTADAVDVTFVLDLPPGFELQATSPQRHYDAAKRRLSWEIGTLRPGDDQYLQVRGVARTAGRNEFDYGAATADRLVGDADTAATKVIAVADLRLDVRDPKGPLPVGADVTYEVVVKNRGATAARNVNVVAMFSGGIEPHDVEGLDYSVSDGRVALDSIDTLGAGEEQVVRIHARAERPGRHVFRAEVSCSELQIRLAEEEMTQFYAEKPIELDGGPRSAGVVDDFVYPR